MKSASARRRLGCLMTTSTPSERRHSMLMQGIIPNFLATHVLMFDRDIEADVFLLRGCFPQLEMEYNISRRTLEVSFYMRSSVYPVSSCISTDCRPASHACVAGRVRHYVCIETVCH